MKNKVIFSVYNGKFKNEDYLNHLKILKRLKSLSAKELEGKYKGNLELSIVLDYKFLDSVKIIAKHFKQESILLIDENKTGKLLFLNDNSVKKIGRLKEINKKQINKLDSWSKVNETYFTFGE